MRETFVQILTKVNEESGGELFEISPLEYANKIFSNANLQLHIEKGEVVGFIAYYANDYKSLKAYVTLIGVVSMHRGKGIGKALLESSMGLLKKEGFKTYSLEVGKENSGAMILYQNIGFTIEEERGDKYLMTLIL